MIFGLISFIGLIFITVGFVFICLCPEKKTVSIISVEDTVKTIGFWQRQFLPEVTKKQQVFDWIFGIILPVICVLFDPIVFGGNERAMMGEAKPFAYLLSFTSIMTLLAFLLWGKKLKWLNGFLSGFFALGGTISLLVGIVIFPLSLIGSIFLIGILGFTPLFSAFVYWRNAVRAYKYAQPILNKGFLIQSAILSALLGFVVPYIANVKIERGLETIQSGDVQTIQRTTKQLQLFSPILNPAVIQRTYNNEHDDLERKKALRESYIKLSGKNPMELPLGEVWD